MENPELPKVEIEIPSQLKLKLEDDCYFIKRKKKVITTENFNGYFYHLKIKYKVKIIYCKKFLVGTNICTLPIGDWDG